MITFVIVNYNKHDLTARCLKALYDNAKNFECVVVDNGSTPENRRALQNEVLPKYPVKYVEADNANGYATGANAGILAASPENDIVWLNNDCFVTCDAVAVIERAFNRAGAGIVGALLTYPDGKIQHDGMDYAPQVLGAFIHGHKGQARPSRYCVAVTGAFMAVRRDVVNKLGLLDTRFFLGCEDSDYCLRAWEIGAPVWFEKDLTAVHLEGATRGRTPSEKRAVLDSMKQKREVSGITAFRAKHSDAFMSAQNEKAKATNAAYGIQVQPPRGLKIDIGCGHNVTPGYVGCDARKTGCTQHVFDFGQVRWPFKDGSVAEIIMQHSIEHISYRRLPHVLGEARRVLAPGGKLIIRTPDLAFIVEYYLKGKTTPEFPPDQRFIAQHFGENESDLSPGWWAVLKLFSGQDYPGNEHRFCFDFPTLKNVLAAQGFPNAVRYHDRPVYSPGEIYCEVLKPW